MVYQRDASNDEEMRRLMTYINQLNVMITNYIVPNRESYPEALLERVNTFKAWVAVSRKIFDLPIL